MARYIDADALYEKTAEWEAQALHMVEIHMNDEDMSEWRRWSTILKERSAFKYDVVNAPTADVVERKWIPCGERLPITTNTYSDEKAKFRHYFSDDVLITERDGFVAIGLYEKCWNGNGVCKESWEWRDDMSTALKPDVVAWMPLPEPYTESEVES